MSEYEYAEMVKTSEDGKLRVLLVPDLHHAEKPDHDGQVPVLRLPHRGYSRYPAQEVGDAVHPNLVEALARWSDNTDLFERYARAFHGATRFHWFQCSHDRNSPQWVAFDTAAWREKNRISDELFAEEKIGGDFQHYVDGDVYGLVVQKKVTWAKLDPTTDDVAYLETREEWEEWEDHEDGSVWGYFGREYATETATERLAEVQA